MKKILAIVLMLTMVFAFAACGSEEATTDEGTESADTLIMATNADTITYVMMHIEYDVRGNAKPKLIGKMLDEKLCVEGLFPIVLLAKRDESGYHFITQSDGTTCAKSSMGMFEQVEIDNDLKAVDTIIREYYGLKPITDKNEEAKKEGESDAD